MMRECSSTARTACKGGGVNSRNNTRCHSPQQQKQRSSTTFRSAKKTAVRINSRQSRMMMTSLPSLGCIIVLMSSFLSLRNAPSGGIVVGGGAMASAFVIPTSPRGHGSGGGRGRISSGGSSTSNSFKSSFSASATATVASSWSKLYASKNNHDAAPPAATQPVDFSDMPLLVGQVVQSHPDQPEKSRGYKLTALLPVASAKKCQIYEAFRDDVAPEWMEAEHPFYNPLVCKLSANIQGMEWESQAYQMLDQRLSPEERRAFVQVYDAIRPSASTQNRAGLIMEKGLDNLRFHIRNKGAYRGETLRQAMQTVIFIVHILHSHGLVWTELKAENFVMTNSTGLDRQVSAEEEEEGGMFFFGIKGIDLESVIPSQDWLRVYTAEACPPEFPVEELYRSLPKMRVDPSFDMWGLGLVLYEMATGKPFYVAGLTDLEYITNQLRYPEAALERARSQLLSVPPQPRKLIQQCMSLNPAERPTCLELLQDPYFQLGQSIWLQPPQQQGQTGGQSPPPPSPSSQWQSENQTTVPP